MNSSCFLKRNYCGANFELGYCDYRSLNSFISMLIMMSYVYTILQILLPIVNKIISPCYTCFEEGKKSW